MLEHPVACDFCHSTGPHRVLVERANETDQSLVECECGLRFYDPREPEDYVLEWRRSDPRAAHEAQSCHELGVWLDEPPPPSFEDRKRALSTYYATVYRSLLPYVGLTSPLVYEVGGGVGRFLRACLDAGADARSRMCDPCGEACRIARECYRLNVDEGAFSRVPASGAPRYHVILANDVIEHSYSPHGDLARMREFGQRGAVLWLKTFLDELDARRRYLRPSDHAHHFTRGTLRRAITQSGWAVVSWEELQNDAQVMVRAVAP